ncbi:carotenoid oxygenase family protein [Oceanicoccus sagamiensis]|nr:carotenoid oxygenase family protein [Oceanicoccus sagamiensis]
MNTAVNMDQLPTIKGNFEAQEQEFDFWVDTIEGKVPEDLTGSFYRNGPGRLKLGDEEFGHWFDGDGMIARTTFRDGKVHFANKFIRTPKYVKETAAGKMIYRGFGGAPKGSILRRFALPAQPANTGLILHGGKFLALGEGGRPFAVEPDTLDTEGEYNYDGRLGKTFSAHGKKNPFTGYYYNFGMRFGAKPSFDFYKISPSGTLVDSATFYLDHMPMLHDFALTENYAIFIQSSVGMSANPLPILLGGSVADAMQFDNRLRNKIIVIDLHNLKLVDEIDIEPLASLHFGNAYEKNNELHFDIIQTKESAYSTPTRKNKPLNIFDPDVDFKMGGGEYMRFVVNLRHGTAIKEVINDALLGEFPQWDWTLSTKENRYALSTAYPEGGPKTYFTGIQKIDRQTGKVEVHDFGNYRFTGEPLMVAKANAKSEDEFWAMCYVYNGNTDKTEVVIIDSEDFTGEQAVIKLDFHMPQGFHGMFTPKVYV